MHSDRKKFTSRQRSPRCGYNRGRPLENIYTWGSEPLWVGVVRGSSPRAPHAWDVKVSLFSVASTTLLLRGATAEHPLRNKLSSSHCTVSRSGSGSSLLPWFSACCRGSLRTRAYVPMSLFLRKHWWDTFLYVIFLGFFSSHISQTKILPLCYDIHNSGAPVLL